MSPFSSLGLVAQLVEHATENCGVAGSIPAQPTTRSRVAQLAEQVAVNHRVGGSKPSPGAIRLIRD